METFELLSTCAIVSACFMQLVSVSRRALAYPATQKQRIADFDVALTALSTQQEQEMNRAKALGVSTEVVLKRHIAQQQKLFSSSFGHQENQ